MDQGLVHNSLFAFLMEKSGTAIMIFRDGPSGDFRLLHANQGAYRLLGYEPEEVPLSNIGARFIPSGDERFERSLKEVMERGSLTICLSVEQKDSARIQLELRLDATMLDGCGYITVFARDVTQRKMEDEHVQEKDARFRLIFEKAPVGILLMNKERNLVDCNNALVEMTGTEKEELLGKPYRDLVHQEDVEKDARLFDLLLSGRIDHYSVEKRYVSRDGRVIYGNLHVSSIRDDKGHPKFALGMLSDITQRKRMEVEVMRTRDYYQSILDNMPTLMWRSNDQLMREYFNKAWLGFTGRTFNEEYGHGWMRGVHPDDLDRLMEAQERSFLTQENFEIEYRLLAFDNQYHWMIDMARPFYDSHGEFKGYVGSVHDNTRWRNIQEHIRQNDQK